MSNNHTTPVIPEKPEDALQGYILAISGSCKPHTVELYKHCVGKLVEFLKAAGTFTMDEITTDSLRVFFLDLQKDHNDGGVHHYFRTIKAFLRWYWDELELDTRNPIDKVRVKPSRAKVRPGIPLTHIEKMVNACKSDLRLRDKAILLCLLDSAARASEFCALQVKDVDFISGLVYIFQGKGDKERYVRFGPRALRALRKYLRTRGELNNHAPLFANDEGEPLNRFSLRSLVDRRADNANVPHPGLHDFRRRCAYEMLRNGISTKMISEYLGHSSVVVTERYLDVVSEDVITAHKMATPSDFLRC